MMLHRGPSGFQGLSKCETDKPFPHAFEYVNENVQLAYRMNSGFMKRPQVAAARVVMLSYPASIFLRLNHDQRSKLRL
jgi:hypothetical protein